MRLATFAPADEAEAGRVGLSITVDGIEYLVDISRRSASNAGAPDVASWPPFGADDAFRNMLALLRAGAAAMAKAGEAEQLARAALSDPERRQRWLDHRLAFQADEIRWFPPITNPGKIIMIGGNYAAHRAERNTAGDKLPSALIDAPPPVPPAFAKFSSTMVGHGAAIVYPHNSMQLDYETELCVVIGKRCKDVPADAFAEVVAGYTICNDVSMRDLQFPEMKRGSTMLGKNLDTAMPIGPYLVTADEVGDPQALEISCTVNGEVRQRASTRNMVCDIGGLIAHYSRLTLEPGDIIATGTPAGVGIFWDPPEYGLLRVGDQIEMSIEKLGSLRNTVVAENEDVANDPRRGPR